jgi:glutamyl-tRNA synthetase
MIAAFSLTRVQQSPARMDLKKLANLNGQYLQELPEDLYLADVRDLLSRQEWSSALPDETWREIALLMRPRIQSYAEVADWGWFAGNTFVRDPGALKRGLGKAWQRDFLEQLVSRLEAGECLGTARKTVALALEKEESKFNLPLRVGLTGQAGGPDLEQVIELLDPAGFAERLRTTLEALS